VRQNRATGARAVGVNRRIWRAWMQLGAGTQNLLQRLSPARLRFVHYSWPLRVESCPCDVDFCDYLLERQIHRRAVFHMGSGGHHLVGRRNLGDGLCNEVLALTLAPREHQDYVKLVVRDASLARHYKVLFADIYSLAPSSLGTYDLVSLFHLGEFSDEASGARRLDDAGVLDLFVASLAPGGLLLFYRRSFGLPKVMPLVLRACARRQIEFVEDFRSLAIYRRVAP